MIDIHSHILPGLDDGAPDLDEALLMAQMAVEDGIEAIIATPHVISGVFDQTRQGIFVAVASMRAALHAAGIPLAILPGAECHLEPDLPQRLADGQLMTLNDTGRYLLVELPASMVPDYTGKVLYEIQLQGVTPIIAHPERNAEVIRRPDVLLEFSKRGILSQVTTASVAGHFGKKVQRTALALCMAGTSQFVASDAHSSRSRTPVLSPASAQLESAVGKEAAQAMLSDNPARVIAGLELEPVLHEPQHLSVWSRLKSKFL